MREHPLTQRALRHVLRGGFFPRGADVLVGLGPGGVGLALGAFLQAHRKALGLGSVLGAFIETGDEASDSAELAAELGHAARGLGLDFTAVRPRGAGARVAVLKELKALAREGGFRVVALGHTLEDDACTVLREVLRHGELFAVRGLCPRETTGVVRPFLPFTYGEATALGVTSWSPWPPSSEPREETHLSRRLLPALRAYHPGVDRALAGLGRSARRYRRGLRATARAGTRPGRPGTLLLQAPLEGRDLSREAARQALRLLGGDRGAEGALARLLRAPSRGPSDRLLGQSLRARWVPEGSQVILQKIAAPEGRAKDGG
ncbi:MAG: hypothetical protein HY909_02705 [Deltaproteobacteria bacterium]|nr:hypothetical protein [Deltaproteobacteria bacterium]